MAVPVTFRVNPGGVSAADQRRVFDSLPPDAQAKLLSLSAAERSRAVCLVLFAEMAGKTIPATGEPLATTGQSGRMWGSQRAY